MAESPRNLIEMEARRFCEGNGIFISAAAFEPVFQNVSADKLLLVTHEKRIYLYAFTLSAFYNVRRGIQAEISRQDMIAVIAFIRTNAPNVSKSIPDDLKATFLENCPWGM